MSRPVVGLVLLVICVAGAGCDTASDGSASGDGSEAGDGSIEVPDVSGGDGASAVAAAEGEGLTGVLADAGADPSFDSARDATACEVTDQHPGAGEMLDEGGEVTITVDCRQVDWESQEGSDREAFDSAYRSAFDEGCQALFDTSPNGLLYEGGTEYTVVDCQNLNAGDASEASDVPGTVPDDAQAAGTDLGELDGCRALFDQQSVVSLNYGTDSVTADGCPVGGVPADGPAPDSPKKPSSGGRGAGRAKAAGGTCIGKQADGTPIAIQVDSGKVNCAGAEALWNDFLRRAPSEGTGSGGFVELDGWECIGAPAAEAPRASSCTRADSSAEFTVSDGE